MLRRMNLSEFPNNVHNMCACLHCLKVDQYHIFFKCETYTFCMTEYILSDFVVLCQWGRFWIKIQNWWIYWSNAKILIKLAVIINFWQFDTIICFKLNNLRINGQACFERRAFQTVVHGGGINILCCVALKNEIISVSLWRLHILVCDIYI